MSNKPDRPNYAHWIRVPAWREEEALALAIGMDPDNPEWRNRCDDDQKLKVREIERAFLFGIFPNRELISPRDFLSAMESNGFKFPKGLIAAVKSQKIEIKNWRFAYEKAGAALVALKKERSATEKPKRSETSVTTLQKIALGVAYGRHGYDPGASRNPATGIIVGEVDRAGFKINQGTVLEALRQAAEALDFEPPEA